MDNIWPERLYGKKLEIAYPPFALHCWRSSNHNLLNNCDYMLYRRYNPAKEQVYIKSDYINSNHIFHMVQLNASSNAITMTKLSPAEMPTGLMSSETYKDAIVHGCMTNFGSVLCE